MESDQDADAVSPPPKVAPESLVLRGTPARAIRFKRGTVIALAAFASVSVVATAWVALKPATFHVASQPDDAPVAAHAPTDTLSALPTSYGDAPKLGPALPGDLGGPILNHQRQMATETDPVEATQSSAVDAEREARAAQAKAARESGLLVLTGKRSAVDPTPQAQSALGSATADADQRTPEAGSNIRGDAGAKVAEARDAALPVDPHRLTVRPSPYTLSAGSVIAASLLTGLRSDLPGLVTAQVTERVFDSATGRIELIPQGARLIGTYDNVVAFGQRRALVVWQRIIMPDGRSIRIDDVPATDPSGYAGLADKVDFHTWTLLKGAAVSSVLGVGSGLAVTGESDLVRAIRESTQLNAARAGDQLVARDLKIQPTITVRPGARVRLVVHRDLVLAPWQE
ncbi:TrbI/VirB10 family protein [Hephaestia sp. GCM10023244]|uniref:TrbI/VirB10 family protein n=1 Tax=unclassified Hephaestia TaxID=2631281 RepID=UPI00207748F3|nr:TrbI/VirB10 family protein [Hephaestia sp. MAHUQ-44]MCM8732334.1 conjugal transfer protein TrbI [Hephaestia sp. MAHUQ-44]